MGQITGADQLISDKNYTRLIATLLILPNLYSLQGAKIGKNTLPVKLFDL